MVLVRILVADDEASQLELVAFNLELGGFSVVTAADGETALNLAIEQRPDLVILDWMMPTLSGIEVCRALRARADTQKIPIIILSARSEEDDRTHGLDMGADDYVTKPFSPRELISRVRAVLRRTRPALMAEMLEFEDLKLYPASRIVERASRPIPLGAKEFDILAVLIERPGQVFSRTQLLDRVWGHGVYVEDRTIDVHLSRLRKALNRGGYRDLIRTVRGSGYALGHSK